MIRSNLINAYISIAAEVPNALSSGDPHKYITAINARDNTWEMLTEEEKVQSDVILADMEEENGI